VVGTLRHKQASRSHCNINQSCSALPQTETLLIRPDRLRHLEVRAYRFCLSPRMEPERW
jgi:hypothetical protein